MSVRNLKRSKTKKSQKEAAATFGPLSLKQLIQMGLRHHQAGNLAEAEKIYLHAIRTFPGNAEVRNNLGALYHGQGRLADAGRHYDKALQLDPTYPEALTNYGLLLHDQGKLPEAAQLFNRLLASQPNHVAALTNLGLVLHKLGKREEAIAAYQKVLGINADDFFAMNNLALIFKEQGRLEEAAAYFLRVTALNPGFVEAHNNLGLAYQQQGRLDMAQAAFEKAVSLNSSYLEARKNLGNLLLLKGDTDNAIAVYEYLLQHDPNDSASLCNLGVLYLQARPAEAVACFRKALAINPEFLAARANLAEALEKLSRVEEAYREALAGLKQEPGHVLLAIVAAKCERRNKKLAQALSRLNSIDLPRQELNFRRQIHFEFGKIYDAQGDTDHAFTHFAEGNRASQALSSDIDPAKPRRHIEALSEQFSGLREPPPEHQLPYKGEDLVFLVGFPRSGTTLLDQILDSHPRIQTMEEKNIIGSLEKGLGCASDDFLTVWQTLGADQILALQKEYLREAQSHLKRRPGSILVDKFPLNITRTALIWRIFPRAKFLLAIRHPADACLSCFMQDFKVNIAMANFFTLEDTVTFYEKVMGLWQRYSAVLPLQYHMVRYEEVITDFEGAIGKTLEFIGVEWHDAVRSFNEHAKTRDLINTPSYHQVTQSLYQHARYRWKRYEKYFAPLQEKLSPFITGFGY